MAIAEAISRVDDPTQRAAISMELFGRSGRQLMPMLLGGARARTAGARRNELPQVSRRGWAGSGLPRFAAHLR